MRTVLTIILIAFLKITHINAQTSLVRMSSIPVTMEGKQISNPWAGGLNFCQFSDIDLNMDGIKDLFVFDKSGNKINTFINQGIPDSISYVHAQEYISKFPAGMTDWVTLIDYNQDGKEDIFTNSHLSGGFAIYKNTSDTISGLSFTLIDPFVHAEFYPPPHPLMNLFVSPLDFPAIIDIDNDGDLDVISFINGNATPSFFKNRSMELYGNSDHINYVFVTNCWGHFYKNPSVNRAELAACKGGGFISSPSEQNGSRDLSTTLFAFDKDNDGDKELILGDGFFKNMILVNNGGDSITADMTSQDTLFPSYNIPVELFSFPVVSGVDANNDGNEDLLISPYQAYNSENFKSILYYKNTGSNSFPAFEFTQQDLLQDNMIDVGEGAYPVFADYNSDGLMDLIVGNYGYFRKSINDNISSLTLFKNIGTSTVPSFELVSNDYQSLSSYNLKNISPAFGDLDNDGDQDMVIGDHNGKLYYFENIANTGDTMSFALSPIVFQNIDVGEYASPQIIDVDRDGLLDLLIGNRRGYLNYLRNIGSNTSFTADTIMHKFGDIDVSESGTITGYSYPFLYDNQGEYYLFVGTERGAIFLYNNLDNNLSGSFNLVDTFYSNIFEGPRSAISAADINDDGFVDFVIGNYEGGIVIYAGDSTIINKISENEMLQVDIFPNPASSILYIKEKSWGETLKVSIFNSLGKEVLRSVVGNNKFIDVSSLHPGIYFCRMQHPASGNLVTKKLLIIR